MRSYFSEHGTDVGLFAGVLLAAVGVGLFTHPGVGIAALGLELVGLSLLAQRGKTPANTGGR